MERPGLEVLTEIGIRVPAVRVASWMPFTPFASHMLLFQMRKSTVALPTSQNDFVGFI